MADDSAFEIYRTPSVAVQTGHNRSAAYRLTGYFVYTRVTTTFACVRALSFSTSSDRARRFESGDLWWPSSLRVSDANVFRAYFDVRARYVRIRAHGKPKHRPARFEQRYRVDRHTHADQSCPFPRASGSVVRDVGSVGSRRRVSIDNSNSVKIRGHGQVR